MRWLKRLGVSGAVLLGLTAPAQAAIGILAGVASEFPFSSPAPDLMYGATLFYEPLSWLVLRGGAYTGEGTWHFPLSVGYVLPGPAEFQLRPRLEAGLDPFTDPDGNGLAWHVGLGMDYLPFDNNWVVGLSVQLVFGVIGDVASRIKADNRPIVDQWLVRTELGIGYKF
ncbi:MAG: hypothetical protein H7338_03225 [Candidatus Sericytochromatia bacterium]|nr:hypothetical protein [Candidatus Sericytochromatia bacterium]